MTKEENRLLLKIIIPWLLLAMVLGWASTRFEFLKNFDANYRESISEVFESISAFSYQNEHPEAVRVVSYYFICTSLVIVGLLIPCFRQIAEKGKKDKYLVAIFLVGLIAVIFTIFEGDEPMNVDSKSLRGAFTELFHMGWLGIVLGLYVIYASFVTCLSFVINLPRKSPGWSGMQTGVSDALSGIAKNEGN